MFSLIILYWGDKIFEISENHGDETFLLLSFLRTTGASHY